jgi:hypothetical protein
MQRRITCLVVKWNWKKSIGQSFSLVLRQGFIRQVVMDQLHVQSNVRTPPCNSPLSSSTLNLNLAMCLTLTKRKAANVTLAEPEKHPPIGVCFLIALIVLLSYE